MEEKKINIDFLEAERAEIIVGGMKIYVKQYLDSIDKLNILESYFTSSDEDGVVKYLESERGLILATIDKMTNLNYKNIDIDKLLASGIWLQIKGKIINFAELLRDIEKISQQKNLESKVNIIADKVINLLDNVSKLDLSPESITSMVEQLAKGKEELANVFTDKVVNTATP